MDVVVYSRYGCKDSETMRQFLRMRGVNPEMRVVDGDDRAKTEWEDLDGQVTPLVVIGRNRIVRGLDCARAGQLLGWIGC